MNKILLFLETVYIYYMFNHFKTDISIHHPFEKFLEDDFLKHPISTGVYESKICPLGNLVGKLFLIWSLVALFLDKKKFDKIHKIFIILLFIGSILLNMNAFMYMVPVFLLEIYLQYGGPI